jgi:hypothetical protein
MVATVDREQCGVGLQNMVYPPAYDELMQIVYQHSPAAHRALQKHFTTRTACSIK